MNVCCWSTLCYTGLCTFVSDRCQDLSYLKGCCVTLRHGLCLAKGEVSAVSDRQRRRLKSAVVTLIWQRPLLSSFVQFRPSLDRRHQARCYRRSTGINCPKLPSFPQQMYLTIFCWTHLRLIYPQNVTDGVQTNKISCLLRLQHCFVPPRWCRM